MSTDGGAQPAPAETWLARQTRAIDQAIHSTVVYLDPLRVQIETQVAQVAHDTWQNAAAWTEAYFERNAPELGSEAAKAIVAVILQTVPGAAPFAPEIAAAIQSEAGKMFAVLVAELKKEGQVIAPPPSPVPAPAPAPPSPAPAPPTPAPEPVKP